MPANYVAIDNNLAANKKMLEVDDGLYLEVAGLYVLAIGFCDRSNTDGDISKKALVGARGMASGRDDLIDEMLRVKLLKENGNGLCIPDYLDWQRSKRQKHDATTRAKNAADAMWKAKREADRNASRIAGGNAEDKIGEEVEEKTSSVSLFDDQGIPEGLYGYWQEKVGREPVPDDIRSFKVMLKTHSQEALKLAIGQAVMQGERADNYALIATIAKAER